MELIDYRATKRRKTLQSSHSKRKPIADWSSILTDILCMVAEKIGSTETFVNFSAVCRHWYISASDFHNRTKKFDFVAPYCMLRADFDLNFNTDLKFWFCTYNPSRCNSKFRFRTYDPKIREKEIVLDLPELSGGKSWGSPFGWMVTFCPIDFSFNLLEPFSRETLRLPSLRTLVKIDGSEYDPYKAFVTANPDDSPNNCIVVLVVHVDQEDYVLAFARPGDDSWSRIQGPRDLNDVVYFKGELYGVRRNRDDTPILVLIQIDQPYPRAVKLQMARGNGKINFSGSELTKDPDNVKYISRRYLVDLNGEFCLVIRYAKMDQTTVCVRIFRINLSTRKLTRVRSLGDQCLFIGNNYTFTSNANSLICEYDGLYNPPANFISVYVFYTHDDDYTFYPHDKSPWDTPQRPDEGLFPILPSKLEYSCMVTTSEIMYPQLWIKRLLRFRRLKDMDGS